jgi:hypothetical protein
MLLESMNIVAGLLIDQSIKTYRRNILETTIRTDFEKSLSSVNTDP